MTEKSIRWMHKKTQESQEAARDARLDEGVSSAQSGGACF